LPESRAAGEEEGRWGSAAAAGSPYELPVRTTWGVGGLPSAYVSENSHTLLLLFFFWKAHVTVVNFHISASATYWYI